MGVAYIGTSGFSYPHWRGVFYPQNLPQSKWFEYYCRHFDTVELNVSFYRLPKKETFENWRKKAGPGFVFAIKGNRYITHVKRLKDCREAVERFFEAAEGLVLPPRKSHGFSLDYTRDQPATIRGVVLWQLPPKFKLSSNQAIERLSKFLEILPKDWRSSQTRQPRLTWRQAFEFRDKSWNNTRVCDLLRQYKVAVVFQDFPGWPITEETTADFVYLRFHGRQTLYSSCYTKKNLEGWARKIRRWLNKDLDVYAYFNNDALGYAVENARTLKKLVTRA